MRITLFDFQKDALHGLRRAILKARPFATSDDPYAVILSAPTGSGKTVTMTALFEAILDSPDEQLGWPLDWMPQHDAVILWVSDMPALNEQTLRKIEAQSDKVFRVGQLVTIDASFDEERLQGGRIYFINTQKLADDKLLTSEGDGRTYSMWKTLTNTARAIPDRFYVVIDEAHRGMSSGRGSMAAQSIMQRFIKGHPESGLVRMPLIIGVSATPKRFDDVLSATEHVRFPVRVPPEEVQVSGLLKERIPIHRNDAGADVQFTILGLVAQHWQEVTKQWEAYCLEEGERVVKPILVVQVEDGAGKAPTRTDLAIALQVIQDTIGRPLSDSELCHAFQEAGDLKVGGRSIRKIEASRIEHDPDVSVVFFKMALSTGWDCPRAEVMVSFRRAQDHTYIAQLLGRMVRTPLARRIEKNAELNDVHLFLPFFDKPAVEQVVKSLTKGEEATTADAGDAGEMVILTRRPGTEQIFEAMGKLVTYRVNAHREQSDIRRYQAIGRMLTIDGIDEAAWDKAKADAVAWIGEQVASLKDAGQFETERLALSRVVIGTTSVKSVTGLAEDQEDYLAEISDFDLDRQFQEAGRSLANGLGHAYWQSQSSRDPSEVKQELIIFARNPSAVAVLERNSRDAFNALYDQYRSSFSELTESQKAAYDALRAASKIPAEILWSPQESIDFKRSPTDQLWDRHLYVEADGVFRTELGAWEEGVLREELDKEDTVAWLRNLPRKPWSIEIPYQSAGKYTPMYPDLLIVRRVAGKYRFDLLEPHMPNSSDNFEKAVGLVRFAERHGGLFDRVELIRREHTASGNAYYNRLKLNQSSIRDKVNLIQSNKQLDALFDAAR